MIENILTFILGFLVAAALSLLAIPALWRRSGELMRRRVEASLPMTREELQAQIDASKAEHAMNARRLEMQTETIRKKAAVDFVEINRLREEVKSLEHISAERREAVIRLEAEREELRERLAARETELRSKIAKLSHSDRQVRKQTDEVEELSRLYEEASLNASARQVELASRETEIERLGDTINKLRKQYEKTDRALKKAMAEKADAEEALSVERERSAELERKLQGMIAVLDTREETLTRREKEVSRLKRKLQSVGNGNSVRGEETATAKPQPNAREAEIAMKLSSLLAPQGKQEGAAGLTAKQDTEIERVRSRLAALMHETERLQEELTASKGKDEDPALRERISNLAAEVVSLAAKMKGLDTPVQKALSQAPVSGGEQTVSLADRIRALQ